MSKLTLKKTETARRSDAFTMNPKDIIVIWEENPRKVYGDEEFIALKDSIKAAKEVIYPIMVRPTEDNSGWKVAQGFRRMKAVLELAEEGFVIESIKVLPIYNEEDILINHIILNNTTKPLTDVELADTLRTLQKMTGEENMQVLASKTGLPYYKVRALLGFAESAGTILKEAVKKDEISFTAAAEIAENTPNVIRQSEILESSKKEAKEAGKKRVSASNVSKALGKEMKISKDLSKLRNILIIAGGFESVVSAIDNISATESELLSILKPELVS